MILKSVISAAALALTACSSSPELEGGSLIIAASQEQPVRPVPARQIAELLGCIRDDLCSVQVRTVIVPADTAQNSDVMYMVIDQFGGSEFRYFYSQKAVFGIYIRTGSESLMITDSDLDGKADYLYEYTPELRATALTEGDSRYARVQRTYMRAMMLSGQVVHGHRREHRI
jgi:hypothetical protein